MTRFFLYRAWGPYLVSLYLFCVALVLASDDREAGATLCAATCCVGLPLAVLAALFLCCVGGASRSESNTSTPGTNAGGDKVASSSARIAVVSIVVGVIAALLTLGHLIAGAIQEGSVARAGAYAAVTHGGMALLTLLTYPLYARGIGRSDSVRAARAAVRTCWQAHARTLSKRYPRDLLEAMLAERMPLDPPQPEHAWAASRELLELLRREAGHTSRRQQLQANLQEHRRAVEQLRSASDLDEDFLDQEITAHHNAIRDLEQQLTLLDAD